MGHCLVQSVLNVFYLTELRISVLGELRQAGIYLPFLVYNWPPGIPFPVGHSVFPAPVAGSGAFARVGVEFLLGPFPAGPLVWEIFFGFSEGFCVRVDSE